MLGRCGNVRDDRDRFRCAFSGYKMSNGQVFNFASAIQIIRHRAADVGDLLTLRRTNSQFREIIDGEHVLDLWAKFLTEEYLDKAFKAGKTYIVQMAKKARDWVKANLSKFATSGIPDIDGYHFEYRFIVNTYRSIDEILVTDQELLEAKKYDPDLSGPVTPLGHALETLDYERATFLLLN